MLLFLGVILVAVIPYFLWFQYTKIHAFCLSLKIKGPPALPLIGNGLLFINKSLAETYKIRYQLTKQYGEYYRIWIGPELFVVMSDPKDVEILLSSPRYIDKATTYRFIKPWLNEGLLLSTGKKWHDHRKMITPAFHFNILEEFVKVFDRLGNTVLDKLNKLNANDDIEFNEVAGLYALDVMCETAMGVSIDALSKPNSEYVEAVKQVAYVMQTRITHVFLRYPFIYKYSELAKRQAAALDVLHGFTDDVICKRRQELLTAQIDNNQLIDQDKNNDDAIGIKKRRAFLDLLLHSTIDGNPLTDLEIREEVDTFMFEGHDTTTSGITFCLYNIAKNPEVQNKCYAETVEVLGMGKKSSTTLGQLNQMTYLELAIKESLRLFPSVPFIGRLAMEDIKLTNNRIIPSGANILVPIYAMGRNEKVFENPDQFKPERFSADNVMNAQGSFNYIPFSAGPRNCIGQKFAIYEIKSILSKIINNFEVSLTEESMDDPILAATLVLKTESSIRFLFKRRGK